MRWLLIVDNADDPCSDYGNLFPPSSGGHILLTTRNSECAFHETVGFENFERLDDADAVDLLLKASGLRTDAQHQTRQDAGLVVEALAGHALAIVHAGAFVRRKFCTLEEYPSRLAVQSKALLTFRPKQAASSYGDVYATFEVSAKVLEASSGTGERDALGLLGVLGFMHFQNVTGSIFERAWTMMQAMSHACDTELDEIGDEIALHISGRHILQLKAALGFMAHDLRGDFVAGFRRACDILASFSLVSIHAQGEAFVISMHPLVDVWARDRMDNGRQQRTWFTAASVIALADKSADKDGFRQIESHVGACVDQYLKKNSTWNHYSMEVLQVLAVLRSILQYFGLRYKAVALARTSLHAAIRILSPGSRKLSFLQLDLAYSLLQSAEFEQATSNFEHLAKIRDPDPHFNSRFLLLVRSGLASALTGKGEYHTAIPILQNCLRLNDQYQRFYAPGINQPMRRELARAYSMTGCHDDAIALIEETVRLEQQRNPTSFWNLNASLGWLGFVYREAGRFDEAINLLRQVRDMWAENLPALHPHGLSTRENLARAYMGVGQYHEAIPLLEETLKTVKQTSQECQKYRMSALEALVDAFIHVDRHMDATVLLEEFITTETYAHSMEVSKRWRWQFRLGRAYCGTGRYLEAKEVLDKILESDGCINYPSYSLFQQTRCVLARSFGRMGLPDKKVELLETIAETLTESSLALHAHMQTSGVRRRSVCSGSPSRLYWTNSLRKRAKSWSDLRTRTTSQLAQDV